MPAQNPLEKVLVRLKKISTPIPRIEVNGAIDMVLDKQPIYRVDVFTIHWARLKRQLKKYGWV